MLDRWASGWISGLSLGLPVVSCLMLLDMTPSLSQIAVAVFILGYTNGAALQIITYLTSRYAGMRNFGKIFGVMSSLITLGVGIGPVIAGVIYDNSQSYALLLIGSVLLLSVGGLLVARLGAYPDWSNSGVESVPAGDHVAGALSATVLQPE
jgi:predicted MFS family arabinose efflux permease